MSFSLVQVNTFYPGFLNDAYAAAPGKADAPYADQIGWLLDMGFSDPHMFTRPLEALGVEATQIIANCGPAQAAWLRENGAGGVLQSEHDALRMQIDALKPDVLYINDCITFDSVFVRTLTHKPKLVIGWRGFPPPDATDWTAFDAILTSFDKMFDWAKARGAKKVIRFHPGFPRDCPAIATPRAPDLDVVFSGSVTRQHSYRIQLLNYLGGLSRLPEPDGFAFGLFMNDASPPTRRLRRSTAARCGATR